MSAGVEGGKVQGSRTPSVLRQVVSHKLRAAILLAICLMYTIVFLDKGNMSVVAPIVSKELGFDKSAMGVVFSAFVVAYGLGQVPGGWLADRFGSRRVMSLLVAVWSAMTLATGLVSSYSGFVSMRFLTGLAEGGAFPTATRAMLAWFTPAERGFVHGITHSFGRLGSAIVPPLAVSIMLGFGWHAVFYACGIVGLLWSLGFFLLYRDRPGNHAWISPAELAYLDRAPGGKAAATRPSTPWRRLLASPNMWFIMLAYGCYNYGIYFFTAWLPTYLVEHRHFSLAQMGFVAALPLIAGMVGDTAGGMLTDGLLRRTGNIALSRKLVGVPAMLLSAAFIIPAGMTESPIAAVSYLSVSLFFMECFIGPAWAIPMDIAGEHCGTVAGLMNMAGNLLGALSPIVFGVLTNHDMWTLPFLVQAGVLALGGLIWLLLLRPEQSLLAGGESVHA